MPSARPDRAGKPRRKRMQLESLGLKITNPPPETTKAQQVRWNESQSRINFVKGDADCGSDPPFRIGIQQLIRRFGGPFLSSEKGKLDENNT